MQSHKKAFGLLRKTEALVRSGYPRFGVNKQREIIRLVYEISKRDKVHPKKVIPEETSKSFGPLKSSLLKKRFPYSFSNDRLKNPYLPKIDLNPDDCVKTGSNRFYPKRIFIESSTQRSSLAYNVRGAFPKADFSEIKSLKNHISDNRSFSIADYNRRRDSLFIIREKYDFYKKCPCTKSAVGCGYHIFNLGFGCIFDCAYCYLQEYTNSPGIILPANLDDFFGNFKEYKKKTMRIGNGEFSDSLMIDHITGYSLSIIDFFCKYPDITFEFKTKSSNIGNLLRAKHNGNIVVSWSLNPEAIISGNEFLTSPLSQRLRAIKKCSQAGYKIGIHFDPVIYYRNWKKGYLDLIEKIFSNIKTKDIAWLSIGTLRFNPGTKKVIEKRFPGNTILDEELITDYDGKLRYPRGLRFKMYQTLISSLNKRSGKFPIYLCMEDKKMWDELDLLGIKQ